MKKLFLVIPNDQCFKCGRFSVAIIKYKGYEFMPCTEEKCPYVEKEAYLGYGKVGNETYELHIRKVKVIK